MTSPLQATTQRRSIPSMVLLPIVVAAAFVAGCGDKPAAEGQATQTAARVDGTEITVHQINQVLQTQPNLKPEQTEAASQQILESLIDQQLAVAQAESQKLDRDPQVVQKLQASRQVILARAYLDKAIASGVAQPSENDIRKYYDEKPALFSNRKAYALQEFAIQATGQQATELTEKLKATRGAEQFVEALRSSGAKFTTNQITQTAENLPLTIIEPLSKVSDGEALYITGGETLRVLLVIASRNQPVTLEQAKPAIEQYLRAERARDFATAEVKRLREAAKVEYMGKFHKDAATPASGASSQAATPAPAPAPETAPIPQQPAASTSHADDADAINQGLSGLK